MGFLLVRRFSLKSFMVCFVYTLFLLFCFDILGRIGYFAGCRQKEVNDRTDREVSNNAMDIIQQINIAKDYNEFNNSEDADDSLSQGLSEDEENVDTKNFMSPGSPTLNVNIEILIKRYENFILNRTYKRGNMVQKKDLRSDNLRTKLGAFFRTHIREERANAISGGPQHPLKKYKSPCWEATMPTNISRLYEISGYYVGPFGSLAKMNSAKETLKIFASLELTNRIRCLPYFFIIGVTKCGTTDLYELLLRHPEIVEPATKEPLYWNRMRVTKYRKDIYFADYVNVFDPLGVEIQRQLILQNNSIATSLITVDSTPNYIWELFNWESIPGNHLKDGEPAFITPHSLYLLNPDFKFIVLMRNPVDRVYSQYLMWFKENNPDQFHEDIVNTVGHFILCFQSRSLRSCAYNHQAGKTGRFISASLYYIFIYDWLQIYPQSRFMFIKSEEYYSSRRSVVKDVITFLDIGKGDKRFKRAALYRAPSNSRSEYKQRSKLPMHEKTRILLERLFSPFNARLAELLDDKKWLWNT